MRRPTSQYADVVSHGETCSWRGCTKWSIWDISEHHVIGNRDWVPYCGEHARAALKSIEERHTTRQDTPSAEGGE